MSQYSWFTVYLVRSIGICIYLNKAPVHLIGFPRGSLISAASISLRGNELTLGRDKIQVISDISLYGC